MNAMKLYTSKILKLNSSFHSIPLTSIGVLIQSLIFLLACQEQYLRLWLRPCMSHSLCGLPSEPVKIHLELAIQNCLAWNLAWNHDAASQTMGGGFSDSYCKFTSGICFRRSFYWLVRPLGCTQQSTKYIEHSYTYIYSSYNHFKPMCVLGLQNTYDSGYVTTTVGTQTSCGSDA